MNGVAPNDRYGICAALSREANRIFTPQAKVLPEQCARRGGLELAERRE